MATVTERLAFLISANADQAIGAFEKTANAADRELGKASKKIDVLAGNMTKFGARGLAVAGTLSTGLFKMAQSAVEDQKAQALLAQQLRKTTNATDQQIESIEKYIDATARATGYADDELRPAFAQLTRATGSASRAQQMLNLALDVSAGSGKDLSAVVLALSKAAMGQTTSLKRLGVPLSDAAIKSKNLDAIMYELSQTFGGQAAVAADTLAGRMKIARIAISEAGEQIGGSFAPIVANAATVVSKGVSSLQGLDVATGGAVGKFASFGAVGLGVVSTLSLMGGQAIKMRDRFYTLGSDGERSLNKIGAAAKYASIGLAAVATSEAVFAALNAASDAAGQTDRALQALNITIGKTDASNTVKSFRDLVKQESEVLRFSNIWSDFGKKITLVGGKNSRTIEDIDRSFNRVLKESGPKAAQKLLQALALQAQALDRSSQQYKDNMMLVTRYQKRIELLTGSTAALDKVNQKSIASMLGMTPEAYEAWMKLNSGVDETTTTVSALDEKLKKLNSTIRDKFKSSLQDANEELKKARQRFDDYRDGIASSITGMLSLRDAIENRAPGQTILDSLTSQVDKIAAFSSKLQTLIGQKLTRSGLSYIMNAGYEAGSQIIDELIDGGQSAVDRFNTITNSLETAASALGTDAAGAFYQSGVDSATALVRGIQDTISKYKIKLSTKGLTQKQLKNLLSGLTSEITLGFELFNAAAVTPASGQVVSGGVRAASVSTASANSTPPGNTYVTVQVMSADPNAVVDALRLYQLRNGSVPIRTA